MNYVLLLSFARKLKIKTTQRNSISLKDTEWESAIHVELVFANSTELHIYLVIIVLIYQLEVFNTSLIYSTVEIQDEGLHLLVPFWRFIKIKHYVLRFVRSKLALNRIRFIFCIRPIHLLTVPLHHRQQYFHSPGSFRPQHVCLILDDSKLRAHIVLASLYLLRIFLTIINRKLRAKHI